MTPMPRPSRVAKALVQAVQLRLHIVQRVTQLGDWLTAILILKVILHVLVSVLILSRGSLRRSSKTVSNRALLVVIQRVPQVVLVQERVHPVHGR